MKTSSEKFALHFHEKGRGLPLPLIHGFPFSSRMWDRQLDSLSQTARVLTPDLPGFGETPASSSTSVEKLAEDCAALLDALGSSEPAVIGGLSMGGYIALAFVRLFPTRVRGLILASTRAGADSAEGKANRDKSIAQVKESGPSSVIAAMHPKLLAPSTYSEQAALTEELKEIMQESSSEGVVAALTAMRDRPDSTPLLGKISVPTLVIHGKEDAIIPPSEAQLIAAEIPHSELHLIEKAGHLPNMEQPEKFNRIVVNFLHKIIEK